MGTPIYMTVLSISVVLLYAWSGAASASELEGYYTREFAVHITGGKGVADQLAAKHSYVNLGQVGYIQQIFVIIHHFMVMHSVQYETSK